MRTLILSVLVLLSSVSSFAQESPVCTPPWTSWGEGLAPCAVGKVCADFEGFRVEALAVNPISGAIAIRDIDRRYCRGKKPLTWVQYLTPKAFVPAECELSARWVEEFAAYEKGCVRQFPVQVIVGGEVTLRVEGR